jgi:hypothetical protein
VIRARPMPALSSALRACLRLGAWLILVSSLSSCIVTTVVVSGYYQASGGSDHEARVASAWRGPEGELAVELEELEGVCRRKDAVLVLTANELDQMFAGKVPGVAPLMAVPHVRLPREILFRGLASSRPDPGSAAWVPTAEWTPELVETGGVKSYALPTTLADAPFAVHWTHRYRAGMPDETGFGLLLSRTTAEGVQHALLLPQAFEPPGWTYVLVPLALATDVLWITLLIV